MPIVDGQYVSPAWSNGVPPAIDADELLAMCQTLSTSQVLVGQSAPSTATEGVVGQFYIYIISTTQNELYQCIAAGTTYTWTKRFPLAPSSVTNAMLAQMPAQTFKGNNSATTAAANDLTVAQAQALLTTATANGAGCLFTLSGTVLNINIP